MTTPTVLPAALFDRLQTPIWLIDPVRLRVHWANRAAIAVWGAADLAALQACDLASALPLLNEPRYWHVAASDTVLRERWLLGPDSRPVALCCVLSGLCLEGQHLLLVEAASEPTEAARCESVLLSEAVERVGLGIWRLDVASGLMQWSREALRMYGLDPDSPPPTFAEYRRLTHPEDRAAWLKVLDQAQQDGVAFEHQFRNLLPDGTSRVIEVHGRCIQNSGSRVTALSVTVQDITQRARMEKMKSEFVSTVSHELRTPLTSIRGSLGLIAGGAAGELPPKAAALLRIAHKNSERLVALVNDILDMQKIESGRMDFHMRSFDLVALIEQALEANQAYAQQFEVALAFVEQLPEAPVLADMDRMMQVMANLLSNAAKFSPPHSQVQVRLSRQRGMFRVAITDQGPGIPKEFQPRVFEKFAQADSSDTRQKGGTGLGLSIAKAIIKRHWGSIGFTTTAGAGTTFYFDVPEYHQRKPARVREGDNTVGQRRLLVCEDDRDTATLLRLMLEREGYVVDVAHSAVEALERVGQQPYAAMTLDLLLPDRDGISLIRGIRAQTQSSGLPIIVVSIRADEERRELSGEALGIVDWLSKPIDAERLVQAVRQSMRHLHKEQAQVLHVEDDRDVLRVVAAVLGESIAVDAAVSLHEAREKLKTRNYDLVIVDISLPDGSGLNLLEAIRDCTPRPPVLVFSAQEYDSRNAREVSAALVKSRTTNRQLSDTIRLLLERHTQINDGEQS